jgi:hypothetical protein
VRENRLHGSEGGEGESPFRPLFRGKLSHYQRLTDVSIIVALQRHLI